MTIHLCAEHLINIHTLSIQASLPTVSNKETKVIFSADGKTLTLVHDNEEASIKLPVSLSPNQQTKVSQGLPSSTPTREVSFRVQLEQGPGSTTGGLNGAASAGENGNIVPWTATDLTDDVEVACSSCESIILPRGRITAWKDLPSEGWAEMMEYWHCHKPVDHHEISDAGVIKGYAAGSRLAVQAGVALVGVVDFLVSPEDCMNVKLSPSTLHCNTCTRPLGHLDVSTRGYNLHKPSLSLSHSQTTPKNSHPPAKWLSAFLLAAAETQGVRKFHLPLSSSSSSSAAREELKIWLFTPDLSFSSSSSAFSSPSQGKEPIRAMKILFRASPTPTPSTTPAQGEKLNAQTLSEGEIALSTEEEAKLLKEELERSSEWFPEKGRVFTAFTPPHAGGAVGKEEWRVGLLERFTIDDLSTR